MSRTPTHLDFHLDKLCRAVKTTSLALRRFREERTDAVEQFVGNHWSELGARDRVPVNLLSLYVQVIGRNLIAQNPRLMVTTFNRAIKPTVSAMERWANKEIERSGFAETMRRVVTDALFSLGIAKVALATPADAATFGWGLGAGQPFVKRVSLDDFVADLHAHDWAQVSFIGHRFRAPIRAVRDSKLYGKARLKLQATPDPVFNPEGDEKANVIGRSLYDTTGEEFDEYCDLWEIYLPRHGVVVTLGDNDLTGPDSAEPLLVQRWLGPSCGPYHVLGYGCVPDNLMPKAPIQDLLDLHMYANLAYRKLFRALERLKEVGLATDEELAERINKASDGETIKGGDRPDGFKGAVFNGQHIQVLLAVAGVAKDLFSYQGGNLELLGGRGPQSKTAAQDEMLNSNAGAGLADMQDATVNHVSSVARALLWYWWHHPTQVQRVEHQLPGLPGLKITREVTPQMRARGAFEDLDLQVDPYSMRHATPEGRMAALDQLVTQILVPMAPVLGSQGIAFDWNAYLKLKAQLMNMPDLSDMLTIQEPPRPQVGGPGGSSGGGGPAMPAATNRTYTRRNVPQQPQAGQSQQQIAETLAGVRRGGNPNEKGAA